jgi:hypothetical protein
MESLDTNTLKLIVTDNNDIEHIRTINKQIIYLIPVIKHLLADISCISNISMPLKLPEYTDIEDFDEVIDIIIKFDNCMVDHCSSFRLMGPAMIASFLGINFNLELKIDDNIVINTKSNFKLISEKLLAEYDVITEIKYEYPYIKFSFPNDKYQSKDLLDDAIEVITYQTFDNQTDEKTAYPDLEINNHYNHFLTAYTTDNSRYRPEIWFYVKSQFLNYVPTSNYVSTTHKTITNEAKYPFGKPNDYQILCNITKDHPLYHISRDFIESLINDQWRWKYFDNETFEQATKVLAHFKKLNNLTWD